ncbi:MAG: SOS response-associated peptidase [Acidobacteriota bacterium]
MCGRYTLSDTGQLLEEVLVDLEVEATSIGAAALDLAPPAERAAAEASSGLLPFDGPGDGADPTDGAESLVPPRFNIAPTQSVAAVREEGDGGRRLVALRWGLVPFWADDLKIGNRMINARSETAATKPSFRSAYKRRRCLLLTDGFYEWKKLDGAKQPIHIHRPGRRPFTFAGLWERWSKGEADGQAAVESCTILTTAANDTVRDVHDRMPVILDGDARRAWLDLSTDPTSLQELLRPYDGALELTPVSKLVNSPRNDTPRCLDPVQL